MSHCNGDKTSWIDNVSKTFSSFFSKPNSAGDFAKKFFVASTLLFISVASFNGVTNVVEDKGRDEIYDGTLTTLFAKNRAKELIVEDYLLDFESQHETDGVLLVSWDAARSLNGIIVRPSKDLELEIGTHSLPPYFRSLVGNLIFEECGEAAYTFLKERTIVACPIANEFAVWGYVAYIQKPEGLNEAGLKFSLKDLAHKIEALTYKSY